MVDRTFAISKTEELMNIVTMVRDYTSRTYASCENSEEVVAMIAKTIYEEDREIQIKIQRKIKFDKDTDEVLARTGDMFGNGCS